MEKYSNSATELEAIIKDGLYGDKDLEEIKKRLDDFEEIYADSVYELAGRNRADLEFKAGSWTLNHLLGSEIHIATKIYGHDKNGEPSSYQIEPNQNFDINIKKS